jgi:hypothetical protein
MRELRRVLGLRNVVLFNIAAIFALRGVTTASKLGPPAALHAAPGAGDGLSRW